MVLGRRGYRQLLLGSVRKTLSAKDTPLLPQPQQRSLYLYWVGEGGDAVRYAIWLRRRKGRLQSLLLNYKTVCSALSSRGSYCAVESLKVVAGSFWLRAKSLILHKPIKVL